MNRIILIPIIVLLAVLRTANIQGQCCPYISELKVIPSNPTTNDEIKIALIVTTTSLGFKLGIGYNILNQNTIEINGCYFAGPLTQPQVYMDTIVVGQLGSGDYILNFTA